MEGATFLGRRERVRAHVKSYFNPDGFDPSSFRKMAEMVLVGLVIGEVAVYIMLQESAKVGELPSYITDVLIVSISLVEFMLGPFIGWFGTQRRRSVMVMWVGIALVCSLTLFAVPKPDVIPETAFCTNVARFLTDTITAKAAVRLAILILSAVSFALARLAVTAHALAYLDEYNPSVNLHMNIAIILLIRVVLLHIGTTMLQGMMAAVPWVQFLLLVLKFVVTVVRLHKYPVVPPIVDRRLGSDRTLFRSLGRVLRSKLAVLQVLSMSLLAAAVWGFGSQEAVFSKTKYHVVPGFGMVWESSAPLRALFVILGVVLCGYMYTEPVMTTFKQKRAVRNSVRETLHCVVALVLLTAVVNCSKGAVAGLDETGYNQPACGRTCGCDRPWTEFQPVCATEQMTTYFSPCHAGCAGMDAVGELSVYANCTCAGGGRVTAGACVDGTCYMAYGLHTLLFTATVLASTLTFAWQATVFLENVDRRDKSVAIGLASGCVSLFAFAGAHGFFKWISISTCAQFRGQRCLLQTAAFVPWVGYSSAALAAASLLFSAPSLVILHRRSKAEKKELKEADIELS